MFIPLRTNREHRRRPVVTETLIIVNMLAYLAMLLGEASGANERGAAIVLGSLGRTDFHLWQLVTYQFLHDPSAIWHLAFNMLFLWVFGAAVEDRLSRPSFLAFYLIGGAVAGLAHLMFSRNPVIGASGSVSAVTGAFLALFPRSRIRVLILIFGIVSIPALWFIGFYFLMDVLRQFGMLFGRGGGGVAYMAHIAGSVYGFSLAFILLAVGIVKREEFDVFFLFKQARRRAAFRSASRRQLAGAWESAPADTGRRLERRAGAGTTMSADEKRLAEARTEINRLLGDHDLPAAAARYRALLATSPDAVLAEPRQLDLANQLQAEGDAETAAKAYELLLRTYPTCTDAPEVRLILAVLYTRQLGRPERARELIERSRDRITDGDLKALADQLLSEIEA